MVGIEKMRGGLYAIARQNAIDRGQIIFKFRAEMDRAPLFKMQIDIAFQMDGARLPFAARKEDPAAAAAMHVLNGFFDRLPRGMILSLTRAVIRDAYGKRGEDRGHGGFKGLEKFHKI